MEVATKLAPANDLATQGKLQSEIADRTLSEGDKIAELEIENSRLRQLVIDLLGWDEREIWEEDDLEDPVPGCIETRIGARRPL
jgi:hypothetical protein